MASFYLSISRISNPSPIVEIHEFCRKCRETQKGEMILDNFSLKRMFTSRWKGHFTWCFPYYVQCLQILLRFIRSHQVSFNTTSNSIYLSHSPVNSAQLARYISMIFGWDLLFNWGLILANQHQALYIHHGYLNRGEIKTPFWKNAPSIRKNLPLMKIYFVFYFIGLSLWLDVDRDWGRTDWHRADAFSTFSVVSNLVFFQKWKRFNFGK